MSSGPHGPIFIHCSYCPRHVVLSMKLQGYIDHRNHILDQLQITVHFLHHNSIVLVLDQSFKAKALAD